jgi:hypothetical protein
MDRIKIGMIRGYWIRRKVICSDCVDEKEIKNLEEDRIIIKRGNEEDDLHLCDRCEGWF